MPRVERSIEVESPVDAVYEQWTKFEDFPRFMEGVHQVRQVDDKTLRWVVDAGGDLREYPAKVVEHRPGQSVGWKLEEGELNSGLVTFHRIGENITRVTLRVEYEIKDSFLKARKHRALVERRAVGDLMRFKNLHRTLGVGKPPGPDDDDPPPWGEADSPPTESD